jgi:colanic acid biosynthesis glycosyl transferase WcaI
LDVEQSRRPLRVLLLIIQYPPDVNPAGMLMGQLFESLAARGHRVSVITAFPHYEHFRIVDAYRGKLAARERSGKLDVLRLWVYASGTKQRMFHRLLSYLSFCFVAMVAAISARRRYDVVFCSNGGFFSGLAAYAFRLVRGVPFVYNVQDLYPEVPVAVGQLRSKPAIAILERLERFMYRTAAHVTVIAPSFRQNLLTKGVPASKVSVIPNWVDTEFIRPLPKDNPFSRQHGLECKFVVSYSGNLGYVYDLSTLLEAAKLLSDNDDISFLIVGDGVARSGLERQAVELGLTNVRFLPLQPRDALPWLRAASDVQVSLYRRGSASYSMPSKVYEIMASGRPLVAGADRGSDVWNLVESTACGVCVEPEDPRGLADAINRLYHDPESRERMARCGRDHAVARYSLAGVLDQYERLLGRLARTDRSGTPRTHSR